MSEPAPANIAEAVIARGDLAKLTPGQRTQYYVEVCRSLGLNPLTKPFEYITLNGRLVLYALRACTDQLRTIHKVSIIDMTESERDGVFTVTVKAQNGEGRMDMAKGAVTIGNLKGDALANAFMKAETKAKRRATLSLCGLGFLDETELETVPAIRRTQAEISANAAKRWRDIDQIQEDILQIKSEAAIERYAREVLTPETMAALGEKQWIAEQWLEERRRELTGHVELEPAGPPIHVDLAGRGKRKEKPQDSIAEAEAGLPPPADPAKWPISEGIDTKSEYVRWAHDQIESIASVEELHRWWGDEVPQRARFRFTPAETEAMKKRCASRRRELEAPVGK